MDGSAFLTPAKVVQSAKIQEGMHVADLGAGSGFYGLLRERVGKNDEDKLKLTVCI